MTYQNIEELEEMIEAVKMIVDVELVPEIIKGLKHSVLSGYERILLEGGPHRIFSPNDVTVLRRDLSLLTAFFDQVRH